MTDTDKIPRIQINPALSKPFSRNKLGIPRKKISNEAAEISLNVLRKDAPIKIKKKKVRI